MFYERCGVELSIDGLEETGGYQNFPARKLPVLLPPARTWLDSKLQLFEHHDSYIWSSTSQFGLLVFVAESPFRMMSCIHSHFLLSLVRLTHLKSYPPLVGQKKEDHPIAKKADQLPSGYVNIAIENGHL